jgi:hypothetical protein
MWTNDPRTDETVWEQLRFIAYLSLATLAVMLPLLAVMV